MKNVSKMDLLTTEETAFAKSYEELKKNFKKAGTSIKKVLKDPEAPYYNDDYAYDDLALAKMLYNRLGSCIPMPVTITSGTVTMVENISNSMLMSHYTGVPVSKEEPAEAEEEEEEEEDELDR